MLTSTKIKGVKQTLDKQKITENKEAYLLEVNDLLKVFKGLRAVDAYSVKLRSGEILGIIGPNGAGKSTVLNLLTGYISPTHGVIHFLGKDITHLPPDEIAKLGIGRTFQNVRLFASMTVCDNVKTAQQLRNPESFFATLLNWPSFLRHEQQLTQEVLKELALFGLDERADFTAIALPYGDQRRLEIVRALALRPKLLLLDEPTAGMNPYESAEVLKLIRNIRDRYQLTIIIIEHNMPVVMQLCERIQVLNYGQIIAEGTPEEVRNNAQVIESYLGKLDENA